MMSETAIARFKKKRTPKQMTPFQRKVSFHMQGIPLCIIPGCVLNTKHFLLKEWSINAKGF